MIDEPDYSDPAYWESQGIKMIEVDLNDEASIESGIQEIVDRVLEVAEQSADNETANF
ncbi:MAG: hypothetical protein V7K90_04750 [Nostoc sp.]|uniref:hypothetical protein n=1 Tax=Nostoc sp. TaxID=1180 RepID=UPI002FFB0FA5